MNSAFQRPLLRMLRSPVGNFLEICLILHFAYFPVPYCYLQAPVVDTSTYLQNPRLNNQFYIATKKIVAEQLR